MLDDPAAFDAVLNDVALDTLAIRAGHNHTHEGEHGEPLFLTSSYVFKNAAEAAARFSGDNPGNVYSRYTNPTVRIFEERIAALEGAEQAVATSSGMAAILSTCMALLKSGDHVVCSSDVFGTTTSLMSKYLAKFGVSCTFVPATETDQWQQAMQSNTALLFLETPSNPLCAVADISAIGDIAHSHGALLVVDNCFCTPALQQPLQWGADLVVHSATKYLDGQGRCLGGVVCGPADIINDILVFIRTSGPSMSPFNAWVFLKGLETLRLRMHAHSDSALELAQWLNQHPAVEQVYYAGLPGHPGHELATRQQHKYGGVLSFKVISGKSEQQQREAAWQVIDSVQFLSLTANLGDAKTTIVHPATTTHGRLSEDQKAAAGITENLIRVAVGLEAIDDIKADLSRGLDQISR